MLRTASLILLTVAIAAAATIWSERPEPPYGPHFRNRSILKDAGTFALFWRERSPLAVADAHASFSEHSLLIRDPAVVEHPDFASGFPRASDGSVPAATGSWSFASLLQRAMNQDANTTQGFVDQWRQRLEQEGTDYRLLALDYFDPAWQQRDAGYALNKAPVQLLGIVNRTDLGKPNGSVVCGAEIHFVYAALPVEQAAHYLSMNLEFALGCLPKQPDFQNLVADWTALNDPSLTWSEANPTYQTNLESLLSNWLPKAATIRLRVNGLNTNGSSTWDTREFGVSNAGLQLQDLERQPNTFNVQTGKCISSGNLLATYATANQPAILQSNYEFDPGPLRTHAETMAASGVVITLDLDVCPSGPTDKVRAALSVNSCLGCHGPETGTEIHHISQRTRGQRSQLSAFLTGAKSCQAGDAIYSDGFDCDVDPPPISFCGSRPQPQKYNDLLRRHLYLYRVSELKERDDWRKELAPFAAKQTH
jgi:hypothetical protein